MSIRVAVIDDTEHVRQMLTSMLALDGFDVVGQGVSAEDAVKIAVELSPDVIIIDYAMPGTNGLAAARRIREAVPRQAIILYSAYLDDAIEKAAKEAGVAVCIGKATGLETLERSISELCLQLGTQ